MAVFIDQLGKTIALSSPPRRIISLVPSQTELLYALGLRDEVVGITKFCIHPTEWFTTKTRIGGTKQIDISRIRQLQPDLVIANKEENSKEQVEALADSYPVWTSDIHTLEDACDMILLLGQLLGREQQASSLVEHINHEFATIFLPAEQLTVAYLIWQNPLMTVGGDTFIHAMLAKAGFENVFAESCRYPEISIAALQEKNPAVVLLSSEPYPFGEKHLSFFRSALPKATIILADGELFSWYGSRLQYAPSYFTQVRQALKNS